MPFFQPLCLLSVSLSLSSEFDKLSFPFFRSRCLFSSSCLWGWWVGGAVTSVLYFIAFLYLLLIALFLFLCRKWTISSTATSPSLHRFCFMTDQLLSSFWWPNDSGRHSVHPSNVTQHLAPIRIELSTQIQVATRCNRFLIIYCCDGSSPWLSWMFLVRARIVRTAELHLSGHRLSGMAWTLA